MNASTGVPLSDRSASNNHSIGTCNLSDNCSHDNISISLPEGSASSFSSEIVLNISGIQMGTELKFHSNSTCTSKVGNTMTSDGAITLSGFDEGRHSLYFTIDDLWCSRRVIDFKIDATSPTAPYIFVETLSPNSVAVPSVAVAGWPNERVTAKIFLSKNDIPCEVEVANIDGGQEHNEIVQVEVPELVDSGMYRFYVKAIDMAGNESSCSQSLKVYDFNII